MAGLGVRWRKGVHVTSNLPILGVCGWSGSGKTTLIEAVLPRLVSQGLRVAVIKHDAHGIDVDRPGKDSDRLFRAGANVLLQGPGEACYRTRAHRRPDLADAVAGLARDHDLVLVEGHKTTPVPKVWLLSQGETRPAPEARHVVAVLPRDRTRLDAFSTFLRQWHRRQWLRRPVFGCVLIGGQSRRMGRPKHLIRQGGRSWLERTVSILRRRTSRVIVAGGGCLPANLAGVLRLPDVPDVEGPMAGILAAMRWAPHATWLLVACDMPHLSLEAIDWLVAARAPGVWATLPQPAGQYGVEPLLAHYDFCSHTLIESLAARREFSLAALAAHPKAISLPPPPNIASAWNDMDTRDAKPVRAVV